MIGLGVGRSTKLDHSVISSDYFYVWEEKLSWVLTRLVHVGSKYLLQYLGYQEDKLRSQVWQMAETKEH